MFSFFIDDKSKLTSTVSANHTTASDVVTKVAPLVWKRIQKASHILLHNHPNPDPDSVGSTLAMYLTLKELGKKVTLIKGDSLLVSSFSHFPGYGEITPKTFAEIDLNTFDLFLALDSGSMQVVTRLPDIVFPPTMDIVVIDHHKTNTQYGSLNLVDASYGSTGEIIFDLLREWGLPITHDVALNLFVAIYSDTGGFRYDTTTSRTFARLAVLTEAAPDFRKIIFDLEYTNSSDFIRFDALALASVKEYCGGKVVIAKVAADEFIAHNIDKEKIGNSNIATILTTVKGWNAAVVLTEKEPSAVRISFRARPDQDIDVSRVAELVGGGGHRLASGARINKPLAEAEADILAAFAKAYPNL